LGLIAGRKPGLSCGNDVAVSLQSSGCDFIKIHTGERGNQSAVGAKGGVDAAIGIEAHNAKASRISCKNGGRRHAGDASSRSQNCSVALKREGSGGVNGRRLS
jgi:hypothetical protein